MMDAMVEMLKMLMNGFIITTSQMKLVLHIKLSAMIMVLDVQLKSNAKTVSQEKDVGLKKELKFMVSMNLEKSKEKKI